MGIRRAWGTLPYPQWYHASHTHTFSLCSSHLNPHGWQLAGSIWGLRYLSHATVFPLLPVKDQESFLGASFDPKGTFVKKKFGTGERSKSRGRRAGER